MQNRCHKFNPRCFLVVLFLSSLSLCLWLGHVPLTAWQATTIDALKLAELRNYFGNDCVLTVQKPERVDLAGENTATAVFSSIILKDRTAGSALTVYAT